MANFFLFRDKILIIFALTSFILLLTTGIKAEETKLEELKDFKIAGLRQNNSYVEYFVGSDGTGDSEGNGTSSSSESSQRAKRNTVSSSNTPEGLLASCQLTNLLLYQALQQQRQVAQTNPLLALATSNLQGLGSNLNLNSLPLAAGGLNLQGSAAGSAPTGSGGLGNILNPFPGGINQNLIFPAAATLTTYTTTSTYVTKMTTTAIITVPLLFGNKPFSTTITRTKTYDVTTSEIKTLTSTIQPTVTTTVAPIAPTTVADAAAATGVIATASGQSSTKNLADEYEEYEEPEAHYDNDVQEEKKLTILTGNKKAHLRPSTTATQDTAENVRVAEQYASVQPSKSSKTRTFQPKNRKNRPQQTTASEKTQGRRSNKNKDSDSNTNSRSTSIQKRYQSQQDQDDYYNPRSPSQKKSSNKDAVQENQFYQRQYGTIQDDDVAVDEDPAAAQYPDDYSYYTRRLKRGEQFETDEDPEFAKLDREYLLEPSTDGDYSGNYQKYEKCPPIPADNVPVTVTITSTETRTITKFLKGQSSSTANVNTFRSNNYNDYGSSPVATTAAYAPVVSSSRTFTPASRSRSSFSKRTRGDSDTAASSFTPKSAPITTTSERTTTDRRAQILRRGRSRYNPSQDYENYNRG